MKLMPTFKNKRWMLGAMVLTALALPISTSHLAAAELGRFNYDTFADGVSNPSGPNVAPGVAGVFVSSIDRDRGAPGNADGLGTVAVKTTRDPTAVPLSSTALVISPGTTGRNPFHDTTPTELIAAQDFLTFTLINTLPALRLDTFSFDFGASVSTAERTGLMAAAQLFYSLNAQPFVAVGFQQDRIVPAGAPGIFTGFTTSTIGLAGIGILDGHDSIEFRLAFGDNSTAVVASKGIYVDNLVLSGSVIPEPAGLSLLMLGMTGLVFWRGRRQGIPLSAPGAARPAHPSAPRRVMRPWGMLGLIGVLMGAGTASAKVIGVTVSDVSSGDYSLTSLSISRGSAGTFTYLPHQLIGVTVTDVDAFDQPIMVPRGEALPAPGTRAALLEDNRLNTGVINITTTNGGPERSLEVTFNRPVINSDGEDIVLLEMGGNDGIRWWIDNDRENRGQNIGINQYSAMLMRGIPFTLYRYNKNGQTSVMSLEDLESPDGWGSADDLSGDLFGLGLDLSNLGVPLGASVNSIRIQSWAGEGGRVDPVLIVGLPAVPEPTSAGVLILAGALLVSRRRDKHHG